MPSRAGAVVVGTDLTDTSIPAISFALREAVWRQSTLTLVTVVDIPPRSNARYGLPDLVFDVDKVRARARDEAAAQLEDVVSGLPPEQIGPSRAVAATVLVEFGDPAEQLTHVAAGAALLVVGHHHRSRWGRLMMGSVALRCVTEAVCPTVVVPAANRAEAVPETAAHPLATAGQSPVST
ncbi:MAG: universal stress protein [Pseudonocardia sp.]|uniref:universal stress protein n=1 Tax=unclassified Pseudonocardia TaxID=2619320 RepID=UPI00086951A3|nr:MULTISPECIES: universal stress protein [unclassified Pseudonocardia]MBN9109738.1 universal stress protein [Pseudonocardia sp.]ODU26722.1 MAG: hypothetical protein ABS80_05980 [Pseudonocardia sp. SCN 72-51]ODV09151.1 MAG: hypothetical protein ABT15_00605 [Pseudonocardia sp. SCN 73-27]